MAVAHPGLFSQKNSLNLNCVEVSSFDLDTHSTATRIVVVTAEDKIDLGCHRYSCYKRYE